MPGAVVSLPVSKQVVPEHRRALKDHKKQAATRVCGRRQRSDTLRTRGVRAVTFWGHTDAPTSGNTVAPPAATSLIYNRNTGSGTPGWTPDFLSTNEEVKSVQKSGFVLQTHISGTVEEHACI